MPPEINRFQAAIVSRLKIMSRLNIAEKRLPQDGRMKLKVSGREIDVRVFGDSHDQWRRNCAPDFRQRSHGF